MISEKVTQLSPHFSLVELTRSQVALRQGYDNTPSPESLANLTRLCVELLEPVRELLKVPLHIDSGYRSTLVNTAVGGAATSVHRYGLAADVIPVGLALDEAFRLIRRGKDLPIDQGIIECNAWLHIALPRPNLSPRHEFLTASGTPGRWHYTKVS